MPNHMAPNLEVVKRRPAHECAGKATSFLSETEQKTGISSEGFTAV